MRKHDMRIVEEILYSFPDICLDLQLRRYILEAGGGPDEAGRVKGGVILPEQIRIIERKEAEPRYMLLAAAAERIADRYMSAAREIRDVIMRIFFRHDCASSAAAELGYDMRRLYRLKDQGVRYMASACIDLYPVVHRWRCELDEDKIEAMNSRMNC